MGETTKITEEDVKQVETDLREAGFNEEEIIKMWLIDGGSLIFSFYFKSENIDEIKRELANTEV